jgi:hypothetical protein
MRILRRLIHKTTGDAERPEWIGVHLQSCERLSIWWTVSLTDA